MATVAAPANPDALLSAPIVSPPAGVIELRHKFIPTDEAPADDFGGISFVVRRGEVDVSGLQARLSAATDAIWTPEGQQGNLPLRRAFHDKLGVGSVLLATSDDLLTKVLVLPWWTEWRALIEPVLRVLGIEEHQMIRCLLAAMPPGAYIPIHHDSGLWSMYSHRVHVPIFTSDRVVFRAGRDTGSMERYAFSQGHVLELNNRAKHEVYNGWDQRRVHLIMDYVDVGHTPLPRIRMHDGLVLYQYRRAIRVVPVEEDADDPEMRPEQAVGGVVLRPIDDPDLRAGAAAAVLALAEECAGKVRAAGMARSSRRYYQGELRVADFWCTLEEVFGEQLDRAFLELRLPDMIDEPERRATLISYYRLKRGMRREGVHDDEVALQRSRGGDGGSDGSGGRDTGEGDEGDRRAASGSDAAGGSGASTGRGCGDVSSGSSGGAGADAATEALTPDSGALAAAEAAAGLGDVHDAASCAAKGATRAAADDADGAASPSADALQRPHSVSAAARRAPAFLVIGVQKCGTTALYEYLCQHPLVLAGWQKEPHFFDWMWDTAMGINLTAAQLRTSQVLFPGDDELSLLRQKYLHVFRAADIVRQPDAVTGEGSPSYILGGLPLAHRVLRVCPWATLIVCLRDPVKRAYSHYQMVMDPTGTESQKARRGTVGDRTFPQVVEEDLQALADAGVAADSDPLDFQREYLDRRPQGHGSHSFVGRGLYALQLELWLRVFPREQIMVVSLDDMRTAEGVNAVCNQVFERIGVPPHPVQDTSAKNARSYDAIPADVAERLRRHYAPHNQRLYKLLGRDFGWR